MPKLTINGREIEVAPGTTVMQACETMGIQIPHFCYHHRLSAPANCRMCMVEVEKMPKPVPSCGQPCGEGMVVHTETPAIKAARESVMESLLINHPLDCPVCDQGGECDLQDQAVAYGKDRSRFHEEKRLVKDKELGPLIKTIMTRCILCTRCIRFLDEVAGTPELGKIHRGEHTEITNLDRQPLTSELSGNLIDVCPVGALTSKPAAFRCRPWELTHTDSIDVLDAVGSAIRIDTRGDEVMRIVPRVNEAINEEWIGDKARFACDALKLQRLDTPYVRLDGRLRPATWNEALTAIVRRIKSVAVEQVAAIAGDLADVESMFALKCLMRAIGSPHLDCRQDGAVYDVSSRAGYIMNTPIAAIEQADALLLIGVDPRHEATMVNARIRKAWRKGNLRVGMIGAAVDLGYPYRHLGNKPHLIQDVISGRSDFGKILAEAKNPMVIVGAGALARADGPAIHYWARQLAEKFNMIRDDWNGFNVLQRAASRVGGLDIGFVPQAYGMTTNEILASATDGHMDVVYLLGADEIDMDALGQAFVIYQGHHGDKGAARADVILPSAAYTEKDGLYVNTEGRPQLAHAALKPVGEAKEDWRIIYELAQMIGRTLPFDDFISLRVAMEKDAPWPDEVGALRREVEMTFGIEGKLSPAPFEKTVLNYYMTDPITRSSPTMAKCVDEILPLVEPEAAA